MATLDERVAFLEGRAKEQMQVTDGLRDSMRALERRMESLERRMESLERRIEAFELRVDARFEAIDRRFEGIERRFEALEQRMSTGFRWLVGVQVTTLIAVVTVALAS